MSIGVYNLSVRNCATCRWWEGVRTVEFSGSKPVRVKADATSSDCMAQKRKTTPGNTCSRFSKWEKL